MEVSQRKGRGDWFEENGNKMYTEREMRVLA